MTISDSELAVMRSAITAVLPDTCTITRTGEGGTLDPATGVWTPNPATTVYTGACLVRQASNHVETQRLFGDAQVTAQRFIAKLPYDAAAVAVDDRFTVTASSDAQLAARHFYVAAVGGGSYLVERRLGLIEETLE